MLQRCAVYELSKNRKQLHFTICFDVIFIIIEHSLQFFYKKNIFILLYEIFDGCVLNALESKWELFFCCSVFHLCLSLQYSLFSLLNAMCNIKNSSAETNQKKPPTVTLSDCSSTTYIIMVFHSSKYFLYFYFDFSIFYNNCRAHFSEGYSPFVSIPNQKLNNIPECIVPIDKSIVPMNIYHEKCDIWNCAQFYVNSNDWIIESHSTSMNSSCWMFNLKLLVFTLLSIRRINCEKYISINKLEVLAIVRVNEADGKNENRSTIVQMLVEKCAI